MPKKFTIKVKVSAGAKTESIEKMDDGSLKIRVKQPPEKGKANIQVSNMLSDFYNVPFTNVVLISGASYREKVFSIELE